MQCNVFNLTFKTSKIEAFIITEIINPIQNTFPFNQTHILS